MTIWASLGRQLRCPRGPIGRTVGTLMRIANARPNALAVAALDLGCADEVLELGCGPGHAVAMMAKQVQLGTVHAIDPSAAMLAQTRARNRRVVCEGRVRLYRAKVEQLPFANASMDKVLAVNVAYFWHEPGVALSEIRRVLRPAGSLSIYVTDASAMRRWPFADPETHRLFDYAELNRALRHGGFCDAAVAVTSVPITPQIAGLIATVTMKREGLADR
jgi:ubiquinone/menaquinone biosynthesis C-methylase UbiE